MHVEDTGSYGPAGVSLSGGLLAWHMRRQYAIQIQILAQLHVHADMGGAAATLGAARIVGTLAPPNVEVGIFWSLCVCVCDCVCVCVCVCV